MKTIQNLKWCVLSLFAIGLFSSCLSDSDNEVQGVDMAYITSVNGSKYAAISYGYFSAAQVQNLLLGKYYIVAYKIINPQSSSTGFYEGEILHVDNDQKPIDETFLTVDESGVDGVGIAGLQVQIARADRHFGDGWLFLFQAKKEAENKLFPVFYYDPESQYDKDGKDVLEESNKVIIDVRFTETSTEFESTNTYKQQYIVANLSELRNEFTPDFSKASSTEGTKKSVNVVLQFRYHKDGESSPNYLGSWESGSDNYYSMIFTEN